MAGARRRPLTDAYVAAVETALRSPGDWIDVRTFAGKMNAQVTASCMRAGYLRVKPDVSDEAVNVGTRRFLALPGSVETKVDQVADGWRLSIRSDS